MDGKHREITHNIGFALIVGVCIAIIFFYIMNDLIIVITVFITGFGGIISNLLGGIITCQSFTPLVPFSKRKIALKYCRADNKKINDGLMTVGGFAFALYLLVVTGSFEVVIHNCFWSSQMLRVECLSNL